jgi:peptide methionine sulfoxide reductase MsrA
LYSTAQGETSHGALKRRYEEVMEENQALRELFKLIHERPEMEANEICAFIWEGQDPLEVLQLVKKADPLPTI